MSFYVTLLQTQNRRLKCLKIRLVTSEPPHGKTNNMPRRKQRRRSAAKLISAFVFATRIVQFLFYLNPKFQASSSFLCLYSLICVGPVRKPHCWFSHEAAHMLLYWNKLVSLRNLNMRKTFVCVKSKVQIMCIIIVQLISTIFFLICIIKYRLCNL